MSDLKRKAPKGHHAKLLLLGEFDTEGNATTIIRDPYYVCSIYNRDNNLITYIFLSFYRTKGPKVSRHAMNNVLDVVMAS